LLKFVGRRGGRFHMGSVLPAYLFGPYFRPAGDKEALCGSGTLVG
jgi:hypothetical protein